VFGIKDIFTTINVLGGAVAVCLCVEGRPFAAGIAVVLGYVFGDTLDGWVARKLGTANQFGAEYDTIADHVSHCLAPAAIVYTVYARSHLLDSELGTKLIAGFLASAIIVAASVRHARNAVSPVEFKGVWAGLPRTILGFVAIAYVNAALAPYAIGGLWIGVVLIPALCVATLTRLPFPSHHLPRGHYWYVNILVASFFVVLAAVLIFLPRFMFDVMFFYVFGYSLTAWMSLTPAERAQFNQAVAASGKRGQAGDAAADAGPPAAPPTPAAAER